jgi:hypothetical protein
MRSNLFVLGDGEPFGLLPRGVRNRWNRPSFHVGFFQPRRTLKKGGSFRKYLVGKKRSQGELRGPRDDQGRCDAVEVYTAGPAEVRGASFGPSGSKLSHLKPVERK